MDRDSNHWEKVHTVHDYYDGPLTGVADLEGHPHAYSRIFDEKEDEWSNEYSLSPVTNEQLDLSNEAYAMFLRWRAAHDVGKLGREDAHPVLAAERHRYNQIIGAVEQALKIEVARAIRAVAEFKGTFHPLTPSGALWVRWTVADS